MADPKLLELLRGGVEKWNDWRRDNFGRPIDLSRADLSGISLERANLSQANLNGAKLGGVDLRSAVLTSANLQKADLRFSNLSCADLNFSNCTDAHFDHAYLIGANILDANLRGAFLPGANLTGAHFHKTDLTNVELKGANLTRATLVQVNLAGAALVNCRVYGVSAWDLTLDKHTTHTGLVITREDEADVIVDDLEVAQFVYLLLNHRKLRNVLNSVTERGVLILGRFGDGGIEILQAVAARLRQFSYLPIIFDFDRPTTRNYTETVKTLVGLSRFVIVDLSGPSVPQELYATVPHFRVPFVPILEQGKAPYSMFKDLLDYTNVVRPLVTFTDSKDLDCKLETAVIAPAEAMAAERQRRLTELFG